MLVAEHDTGEGLDFKVVHGLALLLREVADLGLRELDVLEIALGNLRNRALDLGRRQLEIFRRPFVEFLRQFADRYILALVDLRQDAFDGLAHLGVRGLDRARVHSALEPTRHGVVLLLSTVAPLAPRSWPGLTRPSRSGGHLPL